MYLQFISQGIEETSDKMVQVGVAMIYFQVRWNSDIMWSCWIPNMEVLKQFLCSSSHHLKHPLTYCLRLLRQPWCLDAAPHPPTLSSITTDPVTDTEWTLHPSPLATLPPPPQLCTSEVEVHHASSSTCINVALNPLAALWHAHFGMSHSCPLHYPPLTALIHLIPLSTLVSMQVFWSINESFLPSCLSSSLVCWLWSLSSHSAK